MLSFFPLPPLSSCSDNKEGMGWVAFEFLMKLDESKFKIGKKLKPPAEMLHIAQ